MKALQRAVAFLRAKTQGAGEGTRLAPVKALAQEAGVSHYALCRAAGLLKCEGALDVRPRSGIVVRRPAPEGERAMPGPASGLMAKWEQTALVLGRRVSGSAEWSEGGLILPKALCAEFHLSYPTARKALDHLVAGGMLQPRGRGFVAAGSAGYAGLSVLYLTRHSLDTSTTAQWMSPREFARQLEQTCSAASVPLEYAFLEWTRRGVTGGEEAGVRLAQMAKRCPKAMAVVNGAAMQPEAVVGLCELLQRARTPVAVVLFNPLLDPGRLPRYRLGVVDMGAGPQAGPVMADFVIGKGYRTIAVAVFDEGVGAGWQAARLAAFQARLAQRSAEAQCRVHVIPAAAESDYGGPDLSAITDAWRSSRAPYSRALRQLSVDARRARHMYLLRRAIDRSLKGLIAQGLPDVFVGINDDMAVGLLDVLRARGIEVPRQCAVAGFDDSLDAFTAHLTSYSPNWPGIVRQILRFGMICRENTRGPVALDAGGSVVERLSTR